MAMAEPLVREAQLEDVDAIAVLLAELGYELAPEGVAERVREYHESGGKVWVAEVDSRVVGFLSFQILPFFHADGRGGRIMAMCVSQELRRTGVGLRLLEKMERTAQEMGCSQIEVTSGDHRSDAHGFYVAAGYQKSHQRFLKKL